MTKKKEQTAFTLRSKARALGFMELEWKVTGLEQALDGKTVVVFCKDVAAADTIQRSYYKLLSKTETNIKKADTHTFHFYGGGKILILRASKRQSLNGYDPTETFYRLDWR